VQHVIRVGVEAKPMNVAAVAEILGAAAEARAHLYDAPRYVRPEVFADIIFPFGSFREDFKLGPNIGIFCVLVHGRFTLEFSHDRSNWSFASLKNVNSCVIGRNNVVLRKLVNWKSEVRLGRPR
jgi:hypothetical protein